MFHLLAAGRLAVFAAVAALEAATVAVAVVFLAHVPTAAGAAFATVLLLTAVAELLVILNFYHASSGAAIRRAPGGARPENGNLRGRAACGLAPEARAEIRLVAARRHGLRRTGWPAARHRPRSNQSGNGGVHVPCYRRERRECSRRDP